MSTGKRVITWTWIIPAILSLPLILFGLVSLIIALPLGIFTDGMEFLIVAIVVGGGGIGLLVAALQMRVARRRYRKYIDLVANQGKTGIDEIAKAVGLPYDQTVADLRKMIAQKYFHSVRIDAEKRAIASIDQEKTEPPKPQPEQEVKDPVSARTVTCNGCAANNKIFTPVGKCEYCGSSIE